MARPVYEHSDDLDWKDQGKEDDKDEPDGFKLLVLRWHVDSGVVLQVLVLCKKKGVDFGQIDMHNN